MVLAAIPEVSNIKIVNLKVFMKHTSASLTINENTDYKVRNDFRVILYDGSRKSNLLQL